MTPAESDFTRHRSLLFTIAYEMLGSVADAEDVVQETWLRWADVDHASVREPRAYLARVVSRLALNRLRSLARRRETYVGPWLPEPLVTLPDVADDVVLADAVSTAMLVVLESLTPDERVVFCLREVFGFAYAEIADVLDRPAATVRQIGHRARSHVRARRPQQPVDRIRLREVTDLFLTAAATGDMSELLRTLSPDVTLHTDGGGLRQAALRPIVGSDKVVRFLTGVHRPGYDATVESLNGAVALVIRSGDQTDAVITWASDGSLVTDIFIQRNPEKLDALAPRRLTRT